MSIGKESFFSAVCNNIKADLKVNLNKAFANAVITTASTLVPQLA